MYILFNEDKGFIVYDLEDQPIAIFMSKQEAINFVKDQKNKMLDKARSQHPRQKNNNVNQYGQPNPVIRQKFEPTINMTNSMIDEQLYADAKQNVNFDEQWDDSRNHNIENFKRRVDAALIKNQEQRRTNLPRVSNSEYTIDNTMTIRSYPKANTIDFERAQLQSDLKFSAQNVSNNKKKKWIILLITTIIVLIVIALILGMLIYFNIFNWKEQFANLIGK